MTTLKINCYSWLIGWYDTKIEVPTKWLETYFSIKDEEEKNDYGQDIEDYIFRHLEAFYRQNIAQVIYNNKVIWEY